MKKLNYFEYQFAQLKVQNENLGNRMSVALINRDVELYNKIYKEWKSNIKKMQSIKCHLASYKLNYITSNNINYQLYLN